MRKYLAKLDCNNMLRNKIVIEGWYILKYESKSIIEQYVSLKKEHGLERNTCQKKLLENNVQANYMEGLSVYKKG